jgi:hypothetical protein
MVIAMGIATAVQLLAIPLAMKDHPSSFITRLKVVTRPSSVLNILSKKATVIKHYYKPTQ